MSLLASSVIPGIFGIGPLLSIARNLNGGNLPNYPTCFFLLLIGLALSLFSYFIIETPIRKKAITKKLTISLSICVFCCTLLGLLVQSLDGFPGRLGDSAAAALSSKNTFPNRINMQRSNMVVLQIWSFVGPLKILSLL